MLCYGICVDFDHIGPGIPYALARGPIWNTRANMTKGHTSPIQLWPIMLSFTVQVVLKPLARLIIVE